MNPGGWAARALTGGIAFSGVVAVVIVLLTIYAYLSDVAGVGTRRLSVGTAIALCFTGVAAAALIMFPGGPPALFVFLNRLGPQ